MHPLFMSGFNQTHMIFMVLIFYTFAKLFINIYRSVKSKVIQKDDDDGDFLDKDVEEDIDIYWRSLEGTDQKNMYADEIYKRSKFGIKGLSDESLENLRATDRRKKK